MNQSNLLTLISFLCFHLCLLGQDSLPEAYVLNNKGESININKYAATGQPKIITLWATWCGPCRMELEALKKVYPRWKKEFNLEIVTISVDIPLMVGRARKMFETNGWDYTFLHDSEQNLMDKLGVDGIPYSMLVDGKGIIQSVQRGYYPNYEKQLEKKIKKL